VVYFGCRQNGLYFRARFSTPELGATIKVHDVVSYKFSSLTVSGKPIQPSIYRVRRDRTWEEMMVLRSSKPRRNIIDIYSMFFCFVVLFESIYILTSNSLQIINPIVGKNQRKGDNFLTSLQIPSNSTL
jgi:hypothetical protein